MTDGDLSNTTPIQSPSTTVVPRKGPRHVAPAVRPQPASREAQRLAAAILEVLAGVRTPTAAAAALDMGVPRYYLWEQRALTGLVAACEPRLAGQGRSLRRQITVMEREMARLKQDCARQQALVRAAQRTIGLAPPPNPKPAAKVGGKASHRATGKGDGKAAAKTTRRRRPVVRALKAVAAFRAATVTEATPPCSSGVVGPELLQRSDPSNSSPSAAGGASGSSTLSATAGNPFTEE